MDTNDSVFVFHVKSYPTQITPTHPNISLTILTQLTREGQQVHRIDHVETKRCCSLASSRTFLRAKIAKNLTHPQQLTVHLFILGKVLASACVNACQYIKLLAGTYTVLILHKGNILSHLLCLNIAREEYFNVLLTQAMDIRHNINFKTRNHLPID